MLNDATGVLPSRSTTERDEMARTPMTPEAALQACEAALQGKRPYGVRNINSDNRTHVRAWLVAMGLRSTYVQNLGLDDLRKVYADTSNTQLAFMRTLSNGGMSEEQRQEQDSFHDDEADDDLLGDIDTKAKTRAGANANDAEEASRKLAEALAAITALGGRPTELDRKAVGEMISDRLHIVREELISKINDVASRAPLVIEVRREGDLVGRVEGRHHPKFATLLKAATARDASGHVPNVWISGPAGSGKTRAVSDACKALDIGFEHNGALSMPHELTGFIDAGGKFHDTAFYRAYGAACGYLFDEVDGSDNAALLALNAALANGHASFPCGPLERHKDNRIFVAANTWGQGATAEYVGRAKIDAAFLDRFPVKIHFDYDEELEREICGNPDWARQVQAARAKARSVGLKVAITPRASIGGAALLASGFSKQEVAEMTYLASLTPDQRRQVA